MARTGWLGSLDWFPEISRLQREMNEVFDMHRWRPAWGRTSEYPLVTLASDDEAVTASVEVPGMKMEEIELSIAGDALTIQGERKTADSCCSEGTCRRTERPSGAFMRTIKLPERTNPDKAEARYANGVLTVRIPKDEAAKPRKIAIETS